MAQPETAGHNSREAEGTTKGILNSTRAKIGKSKTLRGASDAEPIKACFLRLLPGIEWVPRNLGGMFWEVRLHVPLGS